MKWLIVTDSSCDLRSLETGSPDIGFETVPFVMNLDGKDYVDDLDLNVNAMVDAMEKASSSHSACPSPAVWEESFEKADRVIAFTISGRLSGSFNSAMVARNEVLEKHPEKQIEVIDSLSTGPKLVMLAMGALARIQQNQTFESVCGACREMARSVRTVFTLSSFHNLVINGRVSKVAGFIAGKLGIRVIGVGSDEGEIHLKEVMRGEQRTVKRILKDMEDHGYNGADTAISYCLNEGLAEMLKKALLARWPGARVWMLPTRGLDSYYAERNGLIVSYATR